jgi:hypothetical protein
VPKAATAQDTADTSDVAYSDQQLAVAPITVTAAAAEPPAALQAGHGTPAAAAAQPEPSLPAPIQVGPVTPLDLSERVTSTPSPLLQQLQQVQQHSPWPQQQQQPMANATAGFMQGSFNSSGSGSGSSSWQHLLPSTLLPQQHRLMQPLAGLAGHSLDPIEESPRPPLINSAPNATGLSSGPYAVGFSGSSPAETPKSLDSTAHSPRAAADTASGSPKYPVPQVSLAQGLADADIYSTQGSADAGVNPGSSSLDSPAAEQPLAARVDSTSPKHRQISLAQGLADIDMGLNPSQAAAAAGAASASGAAAGAATADGAAAAARTEQQQDTPQVPAQQLPGASETPAGRTSDQASPAATANAAPSATAAAATAVPDATAATARGHTTAPGSPRLALVTPFTQPRVQARVAHDLQASSSNSRKHKDAAASIPSSSTAVDAAGQPSSTGGTGAAGSTGAAATAAEGQEGGQYPSAVQDGSSSSSTALLPHSPQPRHTRRPLSEEVEEAIVTQIRPARATSVAADPSRVWALVAQFDSSKQSTAATAAGAAAAVPAAVVKIGPMDDDTSVGVNTAQPHEQQQSPADTGDNAAAAAAGNNNSSSSAVPASLQPQAAAGSATDTTTNSSSSSSSSRDVVTQSLSKGAISPTSSTKPGRLVTSGITPHAVGAVGAASPPTSPHSTSWSASSNASDVPTGLKKIKVGKSKAPLAAAAAGAVAAAGAAPTDSSTAAAQVPAAQQHQQQQQDEGGGDSFIPHFTPGLKPASQPRGSSPEGARLAGFGLPPKPRSSNNNLAGMAGNNSSSNSSSNLALLSNSSSGKFYTAVGHNSRAAAASVASAAASVAAAGAATASAQPGAVPLDQEDSWGPFMHFQQQHYLQQRQQQGALGGSSSTGTPSEGGGEGGAGGGGDKQWEVLPVMPLSPLRVPQHKIEGLKEWVEDDTPPTPRTSVVSAADTSFRLACLY